MLLTVAPDVMGEINEFLGTDAGSVMAQAEESTSNMKSFLVGVVLIIIVAAVGGLILKIVKNNKYKR